MDRQVQLSPADPLATSLAPLACRMELQLPLVSQSAVSRARGQAQYRIDDRLGPIEFCIEQSGLFSVQGQLERFTCDLRLGNADPLDMRIDVSLDMTSLTLSHREEQSWQIFTPWFDVAAHPAIRFRSSAVEPSRSGACSARGLLDIGGVTQLQTFNAVVAGRQADQITGTEIVDLMITGALRCSAFGMPPGRPFVPDRVELRIRARIEQEI
jgi:polyisoprenoid-binding protein YceI